MIRKTFLLSDIIVILAILVVGIAFLPFGSGMRIIGYIILATDACILPFYMHGYKIEGISGTFKKESISVQKDKQEDIMSFLKGEVDTPDFKVMEQGGALLSIYSKKGEDVAYAHFYNYDQILNGTTPPVQQITAAQKEMLLNLK